MNYVSRIIKYVTSLRLGLLIEVYKEKHQPFLTNSEGVHW